MKLICVGKIKETFFREAIQEYEKRLSKYVNLKIIEVPDYDLGSEAKNLEKEQINIMKQIDPKDYVITLEIEGKPLNSEELSKQIEKIQMENSHITWVIGGSNGLHENVKKRSNMALSFSKLTFPHQLFRVLLLEQIYRSYKIKNNETYHK